MPYKQLYVTASDKKYIFIFYFIFIYFILFIYLFIIFIYLFILFFLFFIIYTFPHGRSPNVHRSHKNSNLTFLRYFDSRKNSRCSYLCNEGLSSTLRGPLATISNTKFHKQKVYIQLAECVFAISTEHQRIGFCNRDIKC